MNTNKASSQVQVRDYHVIALRMPQETFDRLKAMSKRQRRGIGPQCAFFVEQQLALEESKLGESSE